VVAESLGDALGGINVLHDHAIVTVVVEGGVAEIISWREFRRANREIAREVELDLIKRGQYRGGGGAAPIFDVRLGPADPSSPISVEAIACAEVARWRAACAPAPIDWDACGCETVATLGMDAPITGWVHSHDPIGIERCDTCALYPDDDEAIRAHDLFCKCDWATRKHPDEWEGE
jgi:hypothetical protein